jgi:hypothetical protein
MTTVDKIMAQALKDARGGEKPLPIRQQHGEDLSIAPRQQTGTGPQPAGIRLTPEQLRARRSRSIAIALALGAFVLVIFAVTIVRLGSGAVSGPDYMRPVQSNQ